MIAKSELRHIKIDGLFILVVIYIYIYSHKDTSLSVTSFLHSSLNGFSNDILELHNDGPIYAPPPTLVYPRGSRSEY